MAIDRTKARKLQDWRLEARGEAYQAPELHGIGVVGRLEMFRGRTGKTTVFTSRIVEAEGRFIRTESGSVYELGTAAPEYVAWLAGTGRSFDPEAPFK